MTIKIIAGKPGSGKTYHMSTLLVDMLEEWVRYEFRKDENGNENGAYPSSVWTNIVFNKDGLNETVSKRVGKEVDAWKYMNYCDDDFFHDPTCTYWWTKFPPLAMIIIDEVHFYLGRKIDFGSLDLESELVNWLSYHRHGKQEIYFLTQHTDQFANSMLGTAEKILEVVNVKSLVLPWPISLPMSDIDELKQSFGISTQYYKVNDGNLRGKAIKWSGASSSYLMSADIYRVYQSHDPGMEASDRPSLKRSPLEGILWFARRHAWHLIPKIAAIVSIPFLGMWMIMVLPHKAMSALVSSQRTESVSEVKVASNPVKQDETRGEDKSVVDSKRVESIRGVVRESSERVPRVVPSEVGVSGVGIGAVSGSSEGRASVSGVSPSERIDQRVEVKKETKKETKIVMLYQKGVMLNDGSKIAIGETLDIDGTTETLSCACPVCGVIGFESGKRIKF
jgi:hypothetical protein